MRSRRPSRRTLKEWATALQNSDIQVLVNAARGLAAAGDERGFDALNDLLSNGSPEDRITAAAVCSGLYDERLITGLKSALAHEDVSVRVAAVQALDRLLIKPVVESLLEALDDEVPAVQELACGALARNGDSRAVQPLIEKSKAPNPRVRAAAIRALGYIGDPAAGPAVAAGLQDTDELVRARAQEELDRSELRHWARSQGMYPVSTGRCPTCGAPVTLSGDATVELSQAPSLETGEMVWGAKVCGPCGSCGQRIHRVFGEYEDRPFREVEWYEER